MYSRLPEHLSVLVILRYGPELFLATKLFRHLSIAESTWCRWLTRYSGAPTTHRHPALICLKQVP